jgi:hypothetical protein
MDDGPSNTNDFFFNFFFFVSMILVTLLTLLETWIYSYYTLQSGHNNVVTIVLVIENLNFVACLCKSTMCCSG